MSKDAALKLALEALEAHADIGIKSDKAITAIKEALAQPDEQLLISNILSHHGLQAIDFVADFKEAMKQVEQEPVAWLLDGINVVEFERQSYHDGPEWTPLYTTPPQRTWVGLTEEEKDNFWKADQMTNSEWNQLFSDIEAKLKEKNNA